MNRLITTCIIVAGVALAANAEINFSAPGTPVTKYVEITTEGINLREKPSTSANKLIWECMDDSDDCQYIFKAKGDATHPEVGEIFPYVSEDGDWVNFYYCGAWDTPNFVWTMKKFVKELEAPGPMTAQEKEKRRIYDIPSMPGYALWVHEGVFDENELYIGRKDGDNYVFVYSVPMPWYDESQDKPLEKYENDYGPSTIRYNKSLTCTKAFDGWVDETYFDLSALSQQQIEWIFEGAFDADPYVIFLINKYGTYPFYGSSTPN